MKALDLYVKSEEKLRPPRDGSYSDYDAHPCQAKFNIMKVLSPVEKSIMVALSEVATEKGLALRVYDMTTTKGKLMAFVKGVRTTPTIVIGGRKMEGIPSKESLLKIL